MALEVEIIFTKEIYYSVTATLAEVAKATQLTMGEVKRALEDGNYDPFSEYLAATDESNWTATDESDPQINDVLEDNLNA